MNPSSVEPAHLDRRDAARHARTHGERRRGVATGAPEEHGLDPRGRVPHGVGAVLSRGATRAAHVGPRLLDGRAPRHRRNTRAAILVGKFGGSLTVINPDFTPTADSPIENSAFKWPLGLAIDSHNNAWTANYFSSTITRTAPSGQTTRVYKLPHGTLPWSEAIDGSNRVWVAGFGRPRVWLLCGADTGSCPPGSSTGSVLSPRAGFGSRAFQHFTSVQLDQAGNVWLSNNWSQLAPPVGGVGIAEIIGAATPVCALLQPLPKRPAVSGEACPAQTAAPLPASLSSSASGATTSAWPWIATGAGVLLLLAAVALLFRRRALSAAR